MSIPDTVHRLRASPAIGEGGVYATEQGHDNPIRVMPLIPPVMEKLNWRIVSADGPGEDVYQILFVHQGSGLPIAWDVPEHPEPGAPIVTSPNDLGKGWIVRPIDNGVKNAYTISPSINIIGAQWFAGTEGQLVVFKVLPIGVPEKDLPYWVLEPLQQE